jgi:hypothetical protein
MPMCRQVQARPERSYGYPFSMGLSRVRRRKIGIFPLRASRFSRICRVPLFCFLASAGRRGDLGESRRRVERARIRGSQPRRARPGAGVDGTRRGPDTSFEEISPSPKSGSHLQPSRLVNKSDRPDLFIKMPMCRQVQARPERSYGLPIQRPRFAINQAGGSGETERR